MWCENYYNNPTCDFSYFLQGAILWPVHVINAFKEARRSLVAPEWRVHLRSEVRKCAITQLEKLIPLHGVVDPQFWTAEADSIMHDMLWTRHRKLLTWLFDQCLQIPVDKCVMYM